MIIFNILLSFYFAFLLSLTRLSIAKNRNLGFFWNFETSLLLVLRKILLLYSLLCILWFLLKINFIENCFFDHWNRNFLSLFHWFWKFLLIFRKLLNLRIFSKFIHFYHFLWFLFLTLKINIIFLNLTKSHKISFRSKLL